MDSSLADIIRNKTEQYFQETLTHYKHLHRYPELSYREKETAAYVQACLKKLGIPYRANVGGYGVLGWIEGREAKSKVIALRADMDALPIQEENDVDFRSVHEGVMHACGHDVHTASLLSAARIISELKDRLKGTVLLVFQPGEEKDPGGASLMLKDGVFDEFRPDAIIGQHAYVDYEVGTVGFESGTIMASADEVHITVRGKGGHGALPHEHADTVLAAAQILVSMQQVVSRRSNPFKPAVLSFGRFVANGATNVIPDEVYLDGSLRCMDEDERQMLKSAIRTIATDTAAAYGCRCDIRLNDGYPCTTNHEGVTDMMKNFAREYLPEEKILGLPRRMTAEDFGFFSQAYPATFYRFGVKGSGFSTGLHTPTFLIDERALCTSVGLFSFLAIRFCS
ncbi:amidohydrolase [Dysgonomonas sp. PH5-45]|uniref:M20 metallopeptidase family protein n=1 Tax=unclassified Dysgonomonas TaxID=2630389 RepID=UPI002476BD35|nr:MULTISPECIES: M20 family metallopeptidase [unclassified Dysgonomonas]MDH6355044.1 amidohydrolase [Dysgonomonas sp. PH5-45]MDH6387944.1 amidohydrolase [Dysgonomonas sp. PH5-37]